jgi:CDP-diacylglycerol--glycerol-3-phosphate 3-phosphatidyltransferase
VNDTSDALQTSSITPPPASSPQSEGVRSIWPMVITVARIVCGPIVAALILWATSVLYADRLLAGFIYALTTIVFVIAALSDWVDGWLARKLDAVTPLGAALDHCADKVLVTCALVALAYAALPFHLIAASIVLLSRDVFVAGLREGLSHSGRALPVNALGKWKAATEMAGIAAFLAFQAAALLLGAPSIVLGFNWAAAWLLWTAAALALVSGFAYLQAAFRR